MTKSHNNSITFSLSNSSNLTWTTSNYQIPDGQPWNGSSVNGDTITFACGRHGTAQIAQSFLNACEINTYNQASGAIVTKDLNDNFPYNLPAQLNFWAQGTLGVSTPSPYGGVNYIEVDIVIAQGAIVGGNNWWVGSSLIKLIDSNGPERIGTEAYFAPNNLRGTPDPFLKYAVIIGGESKSWNVFNLEITEVGSSGD